MRPNRLIVLGVAAWAVYTVSALLWHIPDIFFIPGHQVHIGHKVDFYQVPNAAYIFLRGGPLGGEYEQLHDQYPAGSLNLPNPYHPVFTLMAGGFLQLFSPEGAFVVWFAINTILWAVTAWIGYRRFGKNRYFSLAFVFLMASPLFYLCLRNGQYHIVTTAILFYFLIETVEKKMSEKSAYLFLASLLVKPIALLYIIPLWTVGKRKTVLIGGSLFLVLTSLFALLSFWVGRDVGLYYIVNLIARFNAPLSGPPQAFSLDALLRSLTVAPYPSTLVKVVLFLGLLLFQSIRKLSLLRMLFLWTAYYLLFYDFVYEYHYLILAPFFFVGILKDTIFRTRLAIAAMTAFLLPTPYVLLQTIGYGPGGEVGTALWTTMVLWRVVPLIVLSSLVLTSARDQ